MNDSFFTGNVAWVTGASSGIGAALAHALAARGASLVLSARREDQLRAVQAACAIADRHLVLPLDMLAPDTFEPAVQTVLSRFGHIDLMIHCAGISQRAHAADTQLDVDRRIMEVNYFGPVALTKRVLPSMFDRHVGQIVVVSSLLGKFGAANRSAYSASKHALHGFFDSLRAEVASQGITITVVCPGFVSTNASRNALRGDGTSHDQMDEQLSRGLSSEECARQIVRAIERRRREVYIGGKEKLAVLLNRLAPGLFARMISRTKLK
ncbi:MAG: SDR family oxidoreductase [Pirellulales bacterium]